MAQNRIDFLKQVDLQILKSGSYSLTDEQSVEAVQSIYNESIDSGDTITDAEMPTTQFGVSLDWSAGVANDLIVNLSKGDYSVEQDLTLANAPINQLGPADWETVGTEGFTGEVANKFTIDVFNGDPYVRYFNNNIAYVRKWNGSTWEILGGTESFPADPQSVIAYFTVDSSGNVIAAVRKYVDPDRPMNVYRWNGSSWSQMGSTIYLVDTGYWPVVKGTSSTEVYISYEDPQASVANSISVKKWNGSTWEFIGSQGFNSETIETIGMVIDSNQYPVVAYCTAPDTGEFKIYNWNGSTWSNTTTTTGRSGNIMDTAIDDSDNIYICYTEYTAPNYVKVIKWDGSSWTELGGNIDENGYGSGSGHFEFMKLDQNDNPVVTYTSTDNNVYVKKWNGSTWETVGTPIPIGTIYGIPTVAFDNVSNTIYLSYLDGNLSSYGTVKKFQN